MPDVDVSVIIASDRTGADLDACLASLARQRDAPTFEVLVVSAHEPVRRSDLLVGWIRMEERNPAMRRNRGADFAAGRLLAFIDDDAQAAPDWIRQAVTAAMRTPLFGGLDVLPEGSPYAERISDLLLATPWIGSAIPAHERSPRKGGIRAPSDLALCNLFVERALFDRLGGFDESLGYIGEDTDLVRRAMTAGVAPELDPAVIVFHRRRAFPGPFLTQRWRYRAKTGRLLVTKPFGPLSARVGRFLAGGAAAGLAGLLLGKKFLIPAALAYGAATWLLSSRIWRRDPKLLPVVPFAFFMHHANYWIATVVGAVDGLIATARPGTIGRPTPEEIAGANDRPAALPVRPQ